MPPRTRSSMTPAPQNDNPSSIPNRKVPRCSKCQRPRAGHPRSGCPFTDPLVSGPPSRVEDEGDTLPTQDFTPAQGRRKLEDVSNALGSMHLRSTPSREEPTDDQAIMRERRRTSRPSGIAPLKASDTLVSLTTSSQDIVETLLQPGAFDDEEGDTEPEDSQESSTPTRKAARIVKWQETLLSATPSPVKSPRTVRHPRSSPGSHMPGTLITPNPSFFMSYASVPEDTKTSSNEANYHITSSSEAASFPQTPTNKVRGLSRTMSMEQREDFLSGLGPVSYAMIHVLPKADIQSIADAAREIGFIATVVTNENADDDESLLILGREEHDVAKLLARVQKAESRMTSTSRNSSGYATDKPRATGLTMKAAAGGVVAGAVGTWMGLAFS